MSGLQRRLQMNRLPPMPPSMITDKSKGGKKGIGRGKRNYSPVSWKDYFNRREEVIVGKSKFCVYESGSEGPVCLFLHGGGFSALSWALLSKELTGMVKCRCIAYDARGHGETWTEDDSNLSAETMAKDAADIVEIFVGNAPPPIILVGHSMGGAIAVHIAQQELLPSLIGLTVIDVVEGSALDALSSMQSFLRGRPSSFKSLEHAIEWCVRTGQIKNIDSAKVSMAGQLKSATSDIPATVDPHQDNNPQELNSNIIQEEPEEESTSKAESSASSQENRASNFVEPHPVPSSTSPSASHSYTWRIDLTKTEPFWKGWFEGLSQRFLNTSVPKMLLLAGVDRLDRDLTVGQMQGKFQMQVLQSGHAVHEDVPDKVAGVLASFMLRHKVAEPNDDYQMMIPGC